MDQAALQVLQYIKTDLELFLIDLKYIKEVVSAKLSTPVSPTEFNLTLSELSSVNAPLRRPTIACVCRSSAVNIDAQNLKINVDEQFYDRFFGILLDLQLSSEDRNWVEKARGACSEVAGKVRSVSDDYYEKYDDDRYDDEDSQSKLTFENKNLNAASYVEDSMYSDTTPFVEGATASKVFTASEYDDNCEPTDFADKVTEDKASIMQPHRVTESSVANDSTDGKINIDDLNSCYDDNDFEDQEESARDIDKQIDTSTTNVHNENILKESTVSDDNYDDNDFEHSDHIESSSKKSVHNSASSVGYENDFEDSVQETDAQQEGKSVSLNVDSDQNPTPMVNIDESRDRNDVPISDLEVKQVSGASGGSYYDNDFEGDSTYIVDVNTVDADDKPSQELDHGNPKSPINITPGKNKSIFDGSHRNDDFENSAGIDKNEVEKVGTTMDSEAAENNIDTDSFVNYELNDFEDCDEDQSEQVPTNKSNINQQSDDLEKFDGHDEEEFHFPNLDVIEDSGESHNAAETKDDFAETSPDGKATKYGSLARRDSMLTFLSQFSSPNLVLSDDDEKEQKVDGAVKDKKVNDGAQHSERSSDTRTNQVLDSVLKENTTNHADKVDSDNYSDSDDDGFYEDNDDGFDDPSHFSPEKDTHSVSGPVFSPPKQVLSVIPYPERNESENADVFSDQRPVSATPKSSSNLGQEKQLSGRGSPVNRSGTVVAKENTIAAANDMETYASKPRATAMFMNFADVKKKSTSWKQSLPIRRNIVDGRLEDCDDSETPTSESISQPHNQNKSKIDPNGVSEDMNIMETYARTPSSTAKFLNHSNLVGKQALTMKKFRPNSAHTPLSSMPAERYRPLSAKVIGSPALIPGPVNVPEPAMMTRRISPPPQVPICPKSPLLVRTKSINQVKRPTSADNGWSRTSGTMSRAHSAGNTRSSAHQSKYAEKLLAAQKSAANLARKPPIPKSAFEGCIKPEHKGHVFDDKAPPKKPHIPLECFANTVKPDNRGHIFESPPKPHRHPAIPFKDFEPLPQKPLPKVDESRPVKNLRSFHRLIENKVVIVENATKCVHDICKEQTFQSMSEVYHERELKNERELAMISRNSRKVSPNVTIFAETLESQAKFFQERPQPAKRPVTQDHVDKFRKLIDDTKETSFLHGRYLMCQATVRHEKELKALQESLREPDNRMRKFFDKKLCQLNQARLRSNTAFNHFKNMLASFEREDDTTNKESQQGRVHRAAVECHTILFCCLDSVNDVDSVVQELREHMEAFMENDQESFNFSATNTVHFFPTQFHKYFGNINASPVTSAIAPRKIKKKSKSKKKSVNREECEDEQDNGEVFLTQGSEECANNQCIQTCELDKERLSCSKDVVDTPNKFYSKREVIELLSEWLAGGIDEEKTADEWLDTAIEVVSSIDSNKILRSEGDVNDQIPEVGREYEGKISDDSSHDHEVIACLAEWLEDCLHKQDVNNNKSGKEWLRAAEQCVSSRSKKKFKKKKKKLQPYPCSQCNMMYRGKGKSLPTKLSSSTRANPVAKVGKEVNYLYLQKPQKYKFSNGRSNDKLFCSWECTRQWNAENTPVLHRYDTDQLIRIAAGKFKQAK